MADEQELRQKLEFDATQAISALDDLGSKFSAFGSQLATTVSRLEYFNTNAGKTVAALKQMADSAGATVAAFQAMANIPAASVPAGGGANAAGAGTQVAVANFEAVAAASTKATEAVTEFGNRAQTALTKAREHSQSMMVSWQTLVRVITTQLIVRTLSEIRNAFEDAYTSAMAFSKSIGEIHAIDPSRSFKQIADDVRQMSDAFNQPLSDVAEAQYQTISSQFVTAADRANILTAANQLAKVTAQSLSDAALLLAGALNAYGESADMAGLRSAQFEKTIELGRLRMGELGTAMGRVQTIAHEVGLSMEEVQASFISLSLGGVKATEAATQLRGVMTGLLKPSEGMKGALREMGVESGEAAIATWGFQGTLQKLISTTGGSASEIAKLFQNVRGLAGVLRLATTGAESYAKALEELRKVDQATINKKFEEFTSTDAEQLSAELNKIKNFWTAEFGMTLISQLNTLISLLGGGNGLVGALRLITTETPLAAVAITGLVLAASKFGGAIDWAAWGAGIDTGVRKLASLRAALGLLAAYEVGRMLGNQLGEWISTQIEAPMKALQDSTQKEIDIRKQKTEASIREGERENQTLMQQLRQRTAESAKLYLQDAENMKEAMKMEEAIVTAAFGRLMSVRQKMTQELYKMAEDAAKKAQETIPQEIKDIQTGIVDRTFTDLTKMFDLGHQFAAFKDKAEQLANDAAKLQAAAKDSGEEKAADAAWKRSNAYATLAEQAAKQIGSLAYQREIQDMLLNIDNKRIDALKQQQKVQAQIAKEAEDRAHQAEQHNAELEALRKGIEDKLKATVKDEQGNVGFKSTDAMKKDLAAATDMIAKFEELFKQFGKEDFLKQFMGDTRAFESMKREMERTLAGVDLKTISAAPEAIAGLYAQLQASAAKMRLEVPVLGKLEDFTGLNILSDGLNKVMEAAGKKLNEVMARAVRSPQLAASMAAAENEYEKARTALGNEPMQPATDNRGRWFTSAKDINAAQKAFVDLVAEMDKASHEANITDEEFKKIGEDAAAMSTKISSAFPGQKDEQLRMATYIDTMMKALRQMHDLQNQTNGNTTLGDESEKQKAKAIEDSIKALQGQKDAAGQSAGQLERGKTAADDTKAAIDGQTTSIGSGLEAVASLAQAWWGVADAAQAAAQAAAAASMAGSGGGGGMDTSGLDTSGYVARGGPIRYFGSGGFSARGTDTRPAMLSAGEFVMNAQSTRRFYSQLVAMNAGISPVYRSQGGAANVTVGDIHINGTTQPRETAREVIKSLKRELRRGTSVLS